MPEAVLSPTEDKKDEFQQEQEKPSIPIVQQIIDKYPPPPGKKIFNVGKVGPYLHRITYYDPETGLDLNPSFWVDNETLEIPEGFKKQTRQYRLAMKKKRK